MCPQYTTDTLPCHIHVPVCLWIMDPHSLAPKKNMSHENEVLLQDTTHLIQRPHFHQGSLCQDPAGSQIIWRLPDHCKDCKLKWYGHVYGSSGLAKTILHSTVKGGRRRSRQEKRWEDNIREWTGLEFAKTQRAVENRKKKWRKLVVKSSVVSQWPSQLRDRWWW